MPSSVDIIGRSFFGALAMTSSDSYKIDIRVATSISDYLFLRRLRNQVRDQMTNSTAPVGYLQQFRFYLNKPPNVKVYVAWMGARRAGYLLLRQESTSCFITEAVDERFRKAGAATGLVRFAQGCCADLTAEILLTNTASIKLHESAGFQFCGDDGRIALYRYKR
jgi:GNAT superfamily N-acetyltransferase